MNAAIQRSLKDGKLQVVGKTKYMGRNPQYQLVPFNLATGAPEHYIQTARGVPFVRVRGENP